MHSDQRTQSSDDELSTRPILLPLGVIAAVLLGGCSLVRPHDDPTRFYVLTVPHVPTARFDAGEFKRLKIGLKPVDVPAYLRGKSMVVRTGTNEIHFAEFDRWAEPLDQGIGRVVKEALSSARNVASVTLNSRGDDTSELEVAIRVLACEGVRVENGTSSMRFAATWEVRPIGTNSTPTKRGGFTADAVAWSGKDYGQLAERISHAISDASLALAADLPMEAQPAPKVSTKVFKP